MSKFTRKELNDELNMLYWDLHTCFGEDKPNVDEIKDIKERITLVAREIIKLDKKINPSQRATLIYDKIEAIEAQKGKGSLWPNEKFRHDFKGASAAKVYGLPNGDILIKSSKGKKLWKQCSGYKKGIDYK